MLSHQEALDFVSDVLKISISNKGNLELLNQLIQSFHETIPFQSVTLQAKPVQERGMPTLEEVKAEIMSKRGGLCYTVNTFMKYLLEELGFKVYHAKCSKKIDYDHIATIAIVAGLRYLVDVGSGYPTLEAIPIDFENESQIYLHSFLEYKFIKEEGSSDKVLRLHKKGDFRQSSARSSCTDDPSWRIACIIDPTPRGISFFEKQMSMIYSSPDCLILHTSLRIIQFPNKQAIILRDKQLYVEDSDTHELVLQEECTTQDDTIKKIKQLFPLLHSAAQQGARINPVRQF